MVLNVACSSYDQVVEKCVGWAEKRESHCLTFSAVHMVMEAHDKPEYRAKLNSLDMVNPDGMPVVSADPPADSDQPATASDEAAPSSPSSPAEPDDQPHS